MILPLHAIRRAQISFFDISPGVVNKITNATRANSLRSHSSSPQPRDKIKTTCWHVRYLDFIMTLSTESMMAAMPTFFPTPLPSIRWWLCSTEEGGGSPFEPSRSLPNDFPRASSDLHVQKMHHEGFLYCLRFVTISIHWMCQWSPSRVVCLSFCHISPHDSDDSADDEWEVWIMRATNWNSFSLTSTSSSAVLSPLNGGRPVWNDDMGKLAVEGLMQSVVRSSHQAIA